jgi:isoamylase
MIYMGDEYGHTKGGNNNTYCHDNYVTFYTQPLLRCSYPQSKLTVDYVHYLSTTMQINYFRWDKKEESSSDFFRFCRLVTKFR